MGRKAAAAELGQERSLTPVGVDRRRGITKATNSDGSSSGRRKKRDQHQLPLTRMNQLSNPSARRLSHLESLPTEVLEIIFVHTLTHHVDKNCLSLPRASLSIGKKLSTHYIRKKVFLYICSSRPQDGCLQIRTVPCKEHIEAQSWLLRQPWLTLGFIKQCISEYMKSALLHMAKLESFALLDNDNDDAPAAGPPTLGQLLEPISYMLDPVKDAFSAHDFFGVDSICHRWNKRLDDGSRKVYELHLNPSEGAIRLEVYELRGKIRSTCSISRWRILALHNQTQIPERLLHGPWTYEKMYLLRSLIMGGATVDWVHTTAGETAEQGLYDAILEKIPDAIQALCIPDQDWNSHRGVGVIPTQDHLLLAIDEGCDPECVERLLNAPETNCDLQDVRIVQRIHDLQKKGLTERAEWLSAYKRDDLESRRDIALERSMALEAGTRSMRSQLI